MAKLKEAIGIMEESKRDAGQRDVLIMRAKALVNSAARDLEDY